MRNTTTQRIRLGVFIIIATLLLVSGLYFIGNRQNLFGSNIRLHAKFSNVNGLQLGNNVRFSGIDVGTVNKIRIINDTLILIDMVIEEEASTHIKNNAVATIGSDGLVGNMIVNILPRKGGEILVKDGDTIATYSRIGTDDILTTLNVTNENAALLTSDLLKITDAILEGKGTVGMLINDSTVAADLKTTIGELKRSSHNAVAATRELKDLLASLDSNNSVAGQLLTDSILGEKLSSIVEHLENSSMEANNITSNLDSLVNEIRSGEGALKYLTRDEQLVRNLDTTILNIKESSQKFNQNMDALKNNFLLRGYFKKLERQERREARKADRNNEKP